MDYKAGIVHLSSSDGTLLEISEGKLSPEDLTYIRSLDVYKKGKRKVISYLSRSLSTRSYRSKQEPRSGMPPAPPRPTGPKDTTSSKRPGFLQRVLGAFRRKK